MDEYIKSIKHHWLFAVVIVMTVLTGIVFLGNRFSGFWGTSVSSSDATPLPRSKDARFDILILGIRGPDDPFAEEGGALLTDTIQIVSFDKESKKVSLVSIPRDLYVEIDSKKKDKVNTVYEYALAHDQSSIKFSKDFFSGLTGVEIDKVVIFDFAAFKKIVDSLGGVTITLEKPFQESSQWGYPFYLPAGENHLNGQNALYYVRSRYSTHDFDRSRRQQQVISAMKAKLDSINFFNDPIKTWNIFNTVRKNIITDIQIWDIDELIKVAQSMNNTPVNAYVISTENLLVESTNGNGAYILLPKNNDWNSIKETFKSSI